LSLFLYFIITILFFILNNSFFTQKNNKNFIFLKLYIYWVIFCFLRGLFLSDNYWDFKSLFFNTFGLIILVSIFTFQNIDFLKFFLINWIKIMLPIFIFYIFNIDSSAYGYYLIPITVLILFFNILSSKWKILLIFISIFVIYSDISARSNVLKFIFPFLILISNYFPKFIQSKFFQFLIKFVFFLPFIFLILGFTGIFNIFKMSDYIRGDFKINKVVGNRIVNENLIADSRTFLYFEVAISAIKNNYILFGNTPSGGNDSDTFGNDVGKILKTGKYKRYSNEVSILNIFTWTGLVGVVLYFFIFYKAVNFAIFDSSNIYSIYFGLYVLFRWLFAWIEDFNRFDIMNLTLCIFLTFCYSSKFRKMNNLEVKEWFNYFNN
jgi:hypothetical protein